ncbi:RICIN domain-containing protein [Phytohabitans flavus]|uniref:RICIN domain-containing protein n=1 Tax=Phytohabitans flavus TaxID=1076124 RepID=UPI00362D4179
MFEMKTWATGAAMLACTGALVACGSGNTAPGAAAGTGTPSTATTVTGTTAGTVAGTAPATPALTSPPKARPTPAGAATPVLSGTREVTIVRVQASEGGLALDGRLAEADDDSGRQLFVPTPLGGDTYLIKAYSRVNNHPAADEPVCWQVHNPNNTQSLTIEGALCDLNNPAQRFTIVPNGEESYAISNNSAYLQHFPQQRPDPRRTRRCTPAKHVPAHRQRPRAPPRWRLTTPNQWQPLFSAQKIRRG